jgi:hypothetical protein
MLQPTLTKAMPIPHSNSAPALSGDVFGALINLSGRRRFTSQRLVLYAVLAAQQHDGAVQTARDALKLFTEAHVALVEGSATVPGIFCDELREAYFGSSQADRVIRDFIALANRTLDALADGGTRAAALLQQLVQSGTPLLAVLNQLTQVYEELSKRHAQQVRKQLHGVMTDIEAIAKQARMVSFNAQIMAARAGSAGREFAVVAGVLTDVTEKIDGLVRQALKNPVS